jgi:hypothetical protein
VTRGGVAPRPQRPSVLLWVGLGLTLGLLGLFIYLLWMRILTLGVTTPDVVRIYLA